MHDALLLTDGTREEMRTYSRRDLVAIFFQHKRVAIACFLSVFAAAVLAALVLPAYNAEMKFLVKRERVDPVITGDQSTSQIQIASPEITEQEMNSEADLITSEGLLREVVIANHLDQKVSSSWFHPNNQERKVEIAVRKLRSHLQVEPVRKANIINVTLSSKDPHEAAAVLGSLANLYLAKHTQVSRPEGQLEFFEQQTEQAKKDLAAAEARLQSFNTKEQVVVPDLQRDNSLQKLAEMTFGLEQTRAAIRETENRIATLEQLKTSTPNRITTQLRQGDNPQLMQQLKSTLLNLQLKRTELLTKFQPSYPLVQEVDRQIAEAQKAIDAENARPVREETTDQNPTGEWVRGELAKAQADLSGLKAREAVTSASIARYNAQARQYGDKGIEQQDLLRSAKAAEQNYLLYLKKREEARITDALDRRGILNVAIAEEPFAPALPAKSGLLYLLIGTLGAMFVAVGATFVCEYFDDTVRTPEEVRKQLNVPLVAAIPYVPQLRLDGGLAGLRGTGKEAA